MLPLNQAFQDMRTALLVLYDEREAAAIAHEVLFELTGMDRGQRLMRRDEILNNEAYGRFRAWKEELTAGRPLQYVLGYSFFAGKRFRVDSSVLIPRPETEELTDWVLTDHPTAGKELRLLDIGTGSGCIAITLQLGLGCVTDALDISAASVNLAVQNCKDLGAAVHFLTGDFTDSATRQGLGSYDLIVSNPPYIPAHESASLHINVREYEPHGALFTPDDDPLLFYRLIAGFGISHLNAGGRIYCELHRDYAAETAQLFRDAGYGSVYSRNDMHGNPRMLKACREKA